MLRVSRSTATIRRVIPGKRSGEAPGRRPDRRAGDGRETSAPRLRTARDDLRLIALAGAGFYLVLAGAAVMARGLLPGGGAGHLAGGAITLAAAAAATLIALADLAAAGAAPVSPANGTVAPSRAPMVTCYAQFAVARASVDMVNARMSPMVRW